jgi:hypothetical protein
MPLKWPRGGKVLYVHVLPTSVRKLYRCHVVITRHSLDAPLAQARFWASSDLEADAQTLLAHLYARWEIEVQIARWQRGTRPGSLSSDERHRHPALVVRWPC